MFCPQCGSSVATGALFCASCGASLEQNASTQAPVIAPTPATTSGAAGSTGQPISRPGQSPAERRVLGAAAVIVALFTIVMIARGLSGSNDKSNVATPPPSIMATVGNMTYTVIDRGVQSTYDEGVAADCVPKV